MRNCIVVDAGESGEVEEGEKMKWMERERGVQGKLECSACWQEEKKGFVVDACKAQGDWRVLLLRLEMLALDEVGLPPLGFQTPLRRKSFLLGSSWAPEESRWGLKRGSRMSRWGNKSGRRWSEQVNNDRRGRVGSGPGRGRESSGRLAPTPGRSKVNTQRRSTLLEPLSTA